MTKTVVITGASDGIGRALLDQYAREGARVVGIARRQESNLTSELPPGCHYVSVDLTAPDAMHRVRNAFETLGISAVDVLIHNAGIARFGDHSVETAASIREQVAVNIAAPVAFTHAFFGHVERAKGVIAFVSSVVEALPCAEFATYAATKAALTGFARSVAIENEDRDVSIVCVHPGATRTGMHKKAGVPEGTYRTDKFWAAASVAARIRRVIARRRRAASIGFGNKVIRALGRHAEVPFDRIARKKGRPGGGGREAKRCLITGSSKGIGEALARHCRDAGYDVQGVDIEEHASTSTWIHDLSRAEDVDALVNRLKSEPPFDLVIHNAGISCVGRFPSTDIDAQLDVLRVNLEAPIVLSQAMLASDKIASGGSLVYLSSLAHFVGYPSASVYAATKDGLTSYARSLRVALAPKNIHVLSVFPGPVRTEHARRYAPPGSDESRRADPDDIARATVRAISRRRQRLVPGIGTKVFAKAGRWLPGPTGRALKKALLDKFDDTTSITS